MMLISFAFSPFGQNELTFCCNKQVSNISRSQSQVMHQLETLSNLLRDIMQERRISSNGNSEKSEMSRGFLEPIGVSLVLAMAAVGGGLGILLKKGWHFQQN